jgi:hypothetical protein
LHARAIKRTDWEAAVAAYGADGAVDALRGSDKVQEALLLHDRPFHLEMDDEGQQFWWEQPLIRPQSDTRHQLLVRLANVKSIDQFSILMEMLVLEIEYELYDMQGLGTVCHPGT